MKRFTIFLMLWLPKQLLSLQLVDGKVGDINGGVKDTTTEEGACLDLGKSDPGTALEIC